MPINHDMWAIIASNIWRRWSNGRPRRVAQSTVTSDTGRIRVGRKRSRNSPWGLLNKEAVRHRGREEREKSRVTFAKIDRYHMKHGWVVRHQGSIGVLSM